MGKTFSIFGAHDPREVPLYTIKQASSYLGIPDSTLRAWTVGQDYPRAQGRSGRFQPLLTTDPTPPVRLTFNNLIEAYVLAVITRDYALPLGQVRRAIANTITSYAEPRPLLTKRFATDGVKLYLEEVEGLVDIAHGRGGQLMLRNAIAALKRIKRDDRGLAARLYPYRKSADEPFVVAIDPTVSFGKPTMDGTGVAVAVVADLVAAGEKPKRVAAEFGLREADVGVAVEWQQRAAA